MHFNDSPLFFTAINSNRDGSACLHILTPATDEDGSSTWGRQVAVRSGEGWYRKARGCLKSRRRGSSLNSNGSEDFHSLSCGQVITQRNERIQIKVTHWGTIIPFFASSISWKSKSDCVIPSPRQLLFGLWFCFTKDMLEKRLNR